MTTSRARDKGEPTPNLNDENRRSIRFGLGDCALGTTLVATTADGVCAILLGDDPDPLVQDLRDRFSEARPIMVENDVAQSLAKVAAFVDAPARGLNLPLDMRGTAFQRRVWHALREIPVGSTASYTQIANRIGSPNAVRAVAQACASNSIAPRYSVPSRGAQRRYALRLPMGRGSKTRIARPRGRTVIDAVSSGSSVACAHGIRERVAVLDWQSIATSLDARAYSVMRSVLSPEECETIARTYAVDACFRSRIVMARHSFGRGEYKYFAYPLPELVADLRTALYPPLSGIANDWHETMGMPVRYPDDHAGYLDRCHRAGQTKPTPLVLQYGEGDYNCLHQDLYGEHVFPPTGHNPVVRTGPGFHGWRVRADRATAAHAVAG